MYINEEEIVNHISAKPFHLISEAAEELGVEVYVIGGYAVSYTHLDVYKRQVLQRPAS